MTKQSRKDTRAASRREKAEMKKAALVASLGSTRKLERAGHHLEDLETAVEGWLGGEAYIIASDPDPETGDTVRSVDLREPPPVCISLILGDMVHTLRSALDHIVYELGVAEQGAGGLARDAERASAFPTIGGTLKQGRAEFLKWDKRRNIPGRGGGLHMLQSVNPHAINAIEGIQPYQQGGNYTNDPLWQITDLDNIDKHRRLHVTAAATTEQSIGINSAEYFYLRYLTEPGPVKHGQKLAAYQGTNADYKVRITRDVAFGEGCDVAGASVLIKARELRDYVRDDVLPILTDFL